MGAPAEREGLRQLTQEPGFIQAGNRLLNAPVAARWQRKILTTLATYHEQHQDEPGPGRERLRRMALPMEDDALVLLLIENMRESGAIKATTAGCTCRITRPGLAQSKRQYGRKWPRCLATNRGGFAIWLVKQTPTSR